MWYPKTAFIANVFKTGNLCHSNSRKRGIVISNYGKKCTNF